jgi:hypothetical protein
MPWPLAKELNVLLEYKAGCTLVLNHYTLPFTIVQVYVYFHPLLWTICGYYPLAHIQ